MEDRYRLVYRGEVLEGQHRAVVKKKLGALLKVDGERLDALFGDEPVVIKREADKATAARFQAAFKQAGAKLRVQALENAAPAPETTVVRPAAAPVAAAPPAASPLTLRPKAGDLVDASERNAAPAVVVDVSHLSLAPVGPLPVSAQSTPLVEPDTSHLSLAAPGAALSTPEAVRPAIDVARIHFDVAPAGSDLGQSPAPSAPPPPDTSRLTLE